MKRKNNKISIKWRIFLSLVAFAFVILAVLWILQIGCLEKIYRSIKIKTVEKSAAAVSSNIDNENLSELVNGLSQQNNICITVMDMSGNIYADSDILPDCVIHKMSSETKIMLCVQAYMSGGKYLEYYERSNFINHNYQGGKYQNPTNGQIPQDEGMAETMIYVLIKADCNDPAEKKAIIINSSIMPVAATVSTLKTQLIWVSAIMIVTALIVALILSRHVSKPIEKLNDSAKVLAAGNYDVSFDNSGYKEIGELADTLNCAAAELSKVETLRRELIANVSHDLRTPITMISGYSEVMRDIPNENTPENLQVIIGEANRLTILVNDMLDLSKLQSGMQKLNTETLELTVLIREIVMRFEKMTSHLGFSFEMLLTDRVYVNADRVKLSQVIYNIISNAVNYSTDDKRITIKESVENGVVKVAVTDRGCGISEEGLKYIWQRYYKDEYHNRPVAGTGLGLSIVKSVLDMHGAKYGAESKLGEGSTFWFSLEVKNDQT